MASKPLTFAERNTLLSAVLDPPVAISHAITGALIAEYELEASIRSRLHRVTDEEWQAILLDEEGPLGSFDRKVKFAKYLGILDADMKINFDVIRQTRNLFAHSKRLVTFDHPLVVSILGKIKTPKRSKREFSQLRAQKNMWAKYISLCIHSVDMVAKKRYAEHSAAHRAWMRRHNQRMQKMGGILAALHQPNLNLSRLGLPKSTQPHRPTKKSSDPTNPIPAGGLLALIGKGNTDKK